MDVHDLVNCFIELASLLKIIKVLVQFPGLASDETNNSVYIRSIFANNQESSSRIGLSEDMMFSKEIFNNLLLLSYVVVIVLNSVQTTKSTDKHEYSFTNQVELPYNQRLDRWFLYGLRNDRFNGCRCLSSRSNVIMVSFFDVACLCDDFQLLYFLYLLTLH